MNIFWKTKERKKGDILVRARFCQALMDVAIEAHLYSGDYKGRENLMMFRKNSEHLGFRMSLLKTIHVM